MSSVHDIKPYRGRLKCQYRVGLIAQYKVPSTTWTWLYSTCMHKTISIHTQQFVVSGQKVICIQLKFQGLYIKQTQTGFHQYFK